MMNISTHLSKESLSLLREDVTSAIKKFLCKLHGMQDDHNYVPMLHTLFDKPQDAGVTDQELVNLIWILLEELQIILDCSNVFPKRIKLWMNEMRPTSDKCVQTDPAVELNDEKYVQVTCDNSEVQRRINAFVRRKRMEADTFNRREFCKFQNNPKEVTCARTDAVFVPRQSQKSILKIKRVYNVVDKQENKDSMKHRKLEHWPPLHPSSLLPFHQLPGDLKERLGNLHSTLHENRRLQEYSNVYEIVQEIESRVLYLESLSPEYFNDVSTSKPMFSNFTPAQPIHEKPRAQNHSNLDLVDQRIMELKQKLLTKAKRIDGD